MTDAAVFSIKHVHHTLWVWLWRHDSALTPHRVQTYQSMTPQETMNMRPDYLSTRGLLSVCWRQHTSAYVWRMKRYEADGSEFTIGLWQQTNGRCEWVRGWCVRASTSLLIYIICIYINIYLCIYIYIYKDIRTYVRMYVCMYSCSTSSTASSLLRIYIHTHIHTYIHIYGCSSMRTRIQEAEP